MYSSIGFLKFIYQHLNLGENVTSTPVPSFCSCPRLYPTAHHPRQEGPLFPPHSADCSELRTNRTVSASSLTERYTVTVIHIDSRSYGLVLLTAVSYSMSRLAHNPLMLLLVDSWEVPSLGHPEHWAHVFWRMCTCLCRVDTEGGPCWVIGQACVQL